MTFDASCARLSRRHYILYYYLENQQASLIFDPWFIIKAVVFGCVPMYRWLSNITTHTHTHTQQEHCIPLQLNWIEIYLLQTLHSTSITLSKNHIRQIWESLSHLRASCNPIFIRISMIFIALVAFVPQLILFIPRCKVTKLVKYQNLYQNLKVHQSDHNHLIHILLMSYDSILIRIGIKFISASKLTILFSFIKNEFT